MMSFMTLFSFFNGDALEETFMHTEVPGSLLLTVVANLQLCIVIVLFTYCVTNCTVAMVEGAFFTNFASDAQVPYTEIITAIVMSNLRIFIASKPSLCVLERDH
jgi:hypothetical protein